MESRGGNSVGDGRRHEIRHANSVKYRRRGKDNKIKKKKMGEECVRWRREGCKGWRKMRPVV